MTFWIYNYGLAVPQSYLNIQSKRKIIRAADSAATAKIRGENKRMSHPSYVKRPQSTSSLKNIAPAGYKKSKNSERHQLFRADQIMSAPVNTIEPSMRLDLLQKLFIEKRFRHFPVTNEGNIIVGIISDRDVMKANATRVTGETIIDHIMVKEVFVATEETPIREICMVMFNHHIGAVPIVDHKGKPVGILTRSDILRTMIQHQPIELWS